MRIAMDDNAPRRTVPIKLDVPRGRRGDLHQTQTQFLHCANRTSEWAWRYDDYCITSKSKAENALYDELREETDLTANLVQKGIRRAIEAIQGGVEKLKKGKKTSQPAFDSWSVVYDKRSATFNDDHATLSTPNGRVKAEYVLPPEDEREDTPFGRYYESDDWDGSSATLQYDEQVDTFYLHVTLKNPEYAVDGTERQEAGSRQLPRPTPSVAEATSVFEGGASTTVMVSARAPVRERGWLHRDGSRAGNGMVPRSLLHNP